VGLPVEAVHERVNELAVIVLAFKPVGTEGVAQAATCSAQKSKSQQMPVDFIERYRM